MSFTPSKEVLECRKHLVSMIEAGEACDPEENAGVMRLLRFDRLTLQCLDFVIAGADGSLVNKWADGKTVSIIDYLQKHFQNALTIHD